MLSKCILSPVGLEPWFFNTWPSTFSNIMLPLIITSLGVCHPPFPIPPNPSSYVSERLTVQPDRRDIKEGDEEQRACTMNRVNSHACEQRSPGIHHSNFARKTSVVQRSQWLVHGPIQSAQRSNKSSSAALKAIAFPAVVNSDGQAQSVYCRG